MGPEVQGTYVVATAQERGSHIIATFGGHVTLVSESILVTPSIADQQANPPVKVQLPTRRKRLGRMMQQWIILDYCGNVNDAACFMITMHTE